MALTYEFVDLNEDFSGDYGDGPEDGDYVIVGEPSGSDWLGRAGGGMIGSFPSVHEMCEFIQDRMEREQYWPNVWFQNERGSIDLCRIVEEVE